MEAAPSSIDITMETIFSHFLEVACSICGASRVGLRIVWDGDGSPFVLTEQWFDAGGGEHRTSSRPGAPQMSLFPAAAVRCGSAKPTTDRGDEVPRESDLWDSYGRRAWSLSLVDHECRCTGRLDSFEVEFRACLQQDASGDGHDAERRMQKIIPLLEWIVRSSCTSFERACKVESQFSPPLIGDSRVIREIRRQTRLVACSDVPVLIEGESGTGKEVIARNVHTLSPRSARAIVILNCLEMPPALVQSELFGHVKGSFTGASRDRIGLIESASGGTLFLDEVGEMPKPLQATLLRVLQEKEVRRIGECGRRRVDVRFVFATNRRLRELVAKKRFRLDLYHRMASIPIYIPPLRERRRDIPLLARHFLGLSSKAQGSMERSMTSCAMRRLLAHSWPGNVRELKNEIERAIALNPGARRIEASMLSPHIGRGEPELSEEELVKLPEAVKRLECRMIADALETFSGNRTRTAKHLGITRQGLLKKLKRYRMAPPPREAD